MNRSIQLIAAAAIAAPFAFFAGLTRADTGDANPRDDKRVLNPITVTAERLTAPSEVPIETQYSQSTITAEQIDNLSLGPTTTVQTLLNLQPSILAYTDGPLGTRQNINFRAFASGEFAETYDGIALNDVFNAAVTNQASNINNVLLTPSNIDSVQIYRGINNPAVNSYNSLGGTIDYLPRQPTGQFGVEVEGSYGSFATSKVRAVVNFADFGGFKQVLSYERGTSNGWAASTKDRNNNFFYSANFSTDRGDRLAAYVVYNTNSGYTPFNMPVPLLQANGNYYQWPYSWTYEDNNDSNWLAILDYDLPLSGGIEFRNKVFGGVNDYRRTSYSNPLFQQSATQPYNLENTPSGFPFWLSYPNGPTYDPAAVFGAVDAGTQYHFYGYKAWGIGDSPTLTLALPYNTVTFGGNYTYGSLHSREYWYGSYDMPNTIGYNDAWDESDQRTLISVFAQDEIALFGGNLHVTPGVKYVHAKTSDHDSVGIYYPLAGTVGDTEHFISPTFGLNYKISPVLAIYGAFGRNIKFPDITAYYGGFQTAADGTYSVVPVTVKPEFVNDYELGLRYRQDNYSVTLNGYRENFTNTFINSVSSTTGLTSVSNGGSSRYEGVELQVTANLAKTAYGDFDGLLNYSHNKAVFNAKFTTYTGASVLAGQPLAGVPRDLASAALNWHLAGWRAAIAVRYVGLQYIDQFNAGTPTASTIGAHTIADLGLSKTFELDNAFGGLRSVRLALNVDNLFDKYYFNEAYTDTDFNMNSFVRAVPGAPRAIIGTVDMRF
ncbi:MAG TPA: TonB-dependent receptor [Steroidobacteraceae bacterium]